MSAYKGRVAFVTGASSGIGAAIAEALVKEGVTVVGAARRVERIQALADSLVGQPGRLIAKRLDLSNSNEIEEIFKTIEDELGGVDILVNNAITINCKPIHTHTIEEIKYITNVNQTAVLHATAESVNGMIRRKVNDGYIININSTFGHRISHMPGVPLGIYPLSKYAMTASCNILRQDLEREGLKVRVTSISPGLVDTESSAQVLSMAPNIPVLDARDVAKTVSFVLNMPPSAEITELTIRPTNEVV